MAKASIGAAGAGHSGLGATRPGARFPETRERTHAVSLAEETGIVDGCSMDGWRDVGAA
jgi:hypothetical protein